MSTTALRKKLPSGGGGFRLTRIGRLGPEENRAFFRPWNAFWGSFNRTATGGAEPIEDTFARLAKEWKDAARSLSYPADIKASAGYKELVQLGPSVVPLILQDMDSDPFHWFDVLTDITGEVPFSSEDAGDVERMVEAWKRWGKARNFA